MSPSIGATISSHHAFAATSASLRPRVSTTSNHHHHRHRAQQMPHHQTLTVETMEQPLPQQHNTIAMSHASSGAMLATPTSVEMGDFQYNSNSSNNNSMLMMSMDQEAPPTGLPTEPQLVLLCLDSLRDLRRAYSADDLLEIEGLNADYLSIAIYALSRCFTRPASLQGHNDCMMDPLKQSPLSPTRFGGGSSSSGAAAAAKHSKGKSGGTIFFASPTSGSNNNNSNNIDTDTKVVIPSMEEINHEILYVENPHSADEDDEPNPAHHQHKDEKKQDEEDPASAAVNTSSDPYTWYDYDDMHPSNVHRFFPLSGLASGPSLRGPLTLGEIAAAGLAGLGARSRVDAEKDMIQSPLFEQFVQAVKSKGFFMDPDNDTPLTDPEEERLRLVRQQTNYDERYRKVVAKFRTKLAIKAESPAAGVDSPAAAMNNNTGKPGSTTPTSMMMSGSSPMRAANWLALTSADRQRRRREQALEQARWRKAGGGPGGSSDPHTPDRLGAGASGGSGSRPAPGGNYNVSASPRMSPRVLNIQTPDRVGEGGGIDYTNGSSMILSPRGSENHPLDIEQAERSKAEGNVFMQKKMYPQAVQSYTQALKISPNGPHSHVYFSNRAAALLSMKKFSEAIMDSERSLALKPDYGKAHARLGLAHFLSGNYRQAVEAYTVSLKYDPNNASSKSYLEKAAKRLAEGGSSSIQQGPIQSSFSLVSEWESSQRQQQPQQQRQRSPSPSPRIHHHPQQQQQQQYPPSIPSNNSDVVVDNANKDQQREAEKYKAKGNAFMAHREYSLALEAYTHAIQCSPNGPQSHVYYSNRAAALCYLERYRDAISDSEKSLELCPTYGKAHARLGLSRFFLQDYAGAVAAYTAALQHDPDNAASKSYLAKAKAKLEGRSSRSSSRNPSPSPSHRRHHSGMSSS